MTPSKPVMTNLLLDARFALRMLLKHKAFTASALATIAIAIAANTAIFTLVSSVLLRPLALPTPERVVRIEERHDVGLRNLTGANFTDVKARVRSLEHVAAFRLNSPGLSAGAAPEQVMAAEVSPDYLSVLGVAPIVGRRFEAADFTSGAPRTVILTHGVWLRVFGGRREVPGSIVLVNAVPTQIIGVLPSGTFVPGNPQIIVPQSTASPLYRNRRSHLFTVIARLRGDTPIESASEELAIVARQILADSGGADAGLEFAVTPLQQRVVQPVRTALLTLWVAAGVLLLIGATNIANLLLMQGSSRAREFAIRTAIGAPRLRLVRQFATEALILAACGGVAGGVLGLWSISILRPLLPANLPRASEMGTDARTFVFIVPVSLLTALIFGAAPTIRVPSGGPADALRERQGDTRSQSTLRAAFVVAQVALTVVLLSAAGLLARSFASVTKVDVGFEPHNVVAFDISLPPARYADARAQGAFLTRALEGIRTLPGVVAAGATGALPMSGTPSTEMVPEGARSGDFFADIVTASPGLFEALGIPLKRGRLISGTDARGGSPVMLLNETAARMYWPDGSDPVGRKVTMHGWGDPYMAEVVGVVNDVRQAGPEMEARPGAYYPVAQFPETVLRNSIVIRATSDPIALVGSAREQILRIDPTQPIASVRTMEQVLAAAIAQRRFNLILLGFFALTALGLATIGLYGIVAFAVAQRTREICVRVALGARPSDVARLVCMHGVTPVLVGLAGGLVATIAATRAIRNLLFVVQPNDVTTLVAVVTAVTAAALIACTAPAVRAMKIDPAAMLRE